MSTVKTTVTFKCGHTEEFETLGEMRQTTIELIKNKILCSDCCLEKFKKVDKGKKVMAENGIKKFLMLFLCIFAAVVLTFLYLFIVKVGKWILIIATLSALIAALLYVTVMRKKG